MWGWVGMSTSSTVQCIQVGEMSNKEYYGKFPSDIGTSFPYIFVGPTFQNSHFWIPKDIQVHIGTFAQCTQRGADVHKCALDCNQFSLRQCTVSQSLYHWYYQTLVKGETWGNCNKRLLSIQERCLSCACQYHIWLHLSLSLQRNFLKFVKPHITTVTQDHFHSTVHPNS